MIIDHHFGRKNKIPTKHFKSFSNEPFQTGNVSFNFNLIR